MFHDIRKTILTSEQSSVYQFIIFKKLNFDFNLHFLRVDKDYFKIWFSNTYNKKVLYLLIFDILLIYYLWEILNYIFSTLNTNNSDFYSSIKQT